MEFAIYTFFQAADKAKQESLDERARLEEVFTQNNL